jgi:hypothetical protein
VAEENLFTMLAAYRPGSHATPFENYCTTALAYLLQRGEPGLVALFGELAGVPGAAVVAARPQARVGLGPIADLVLQLERGRQVVVEVEIEPGSGLRHLAELEDAATREWVDDAACILVTVSPVANPGRWKVVTWRELADVLAGSDEPLARQLSDFIDRDILGLGTVPLEEALATNRLYALGAAAVRRRFGSEVRYENSASRPLGGRYRYIGTTFSLGEGEMSYWVGLVNEAVPLSDHYYLMLASKERPLEQPSSHPRATAEWKWPHWTSHGRLVRPVTAEMYDDLLRRIRLDR